MSEPRGELLAPQLMSPDVNQSTPAVLCCLTLCQVTLNNLTVILSTVQTHCMNYAYERDGLSGIR